MIEIPQDEVLEIKRVMKIASARQLALSSLSFSYRFDSFALFGFLLGVGSLPRSTCSSINYIYYYFKL